MQTTDVVAKVVIRVNKGELGKLQSVSGYTGQL